MLQLFQTRDGPFFFTVTLVYTCRAFFAWSQFVSVCFGIKLFFSFKIHCLQLLQLFQTRDGPFFSIVTLVYSVYIAFPYVMHLYTLITLFLVLHQKIFVPRSGQLFFHRHTCIQWFHSFSLYNALYTLATLFFQSDQIFFHRHTCIQWLHSFSLCNAFVYTCHTFFQHLTSENFAPCILLCTACLSLFNNDVPFKELVIYNLLY